MMGNTIIISDANALLYVANDIETGYDVPSCFVLLAVLSIPGIVEQVYETPKMRIMIYQLFYQMIHLNAVAVTALRQLYGLDMIVQEHRH
jgi:hypothetical protein